MKSFLKYVALSLILAPMALATPSMAIQPQQPQQAPIPVDVDRLQRIVTFLLSGGSHNEAVALAASINDLITEQQQSSATAAANDQLAKLTKELADLKAQNAAPKAATEAK